MVTQNIMNDVEQEELLALGRMVSYACERAKVMKLDFSSYCLEMALAALIQDTAKYQGGRVEEAMQTKTLPTPSHYDAGVH